MKLAENRLTSIFDQLECADTKTLHGGVPAGFGTVTHLPHQHVCGFKHQ